MNFDELQASVLQVVRRPDLIITIKQKINAAIRLAHTSGKYARDLEEYTYAPEEIISTVTNGYSVTLPDRIRTIDYIQTSVGKVDLVTPQHILIHLNHALPTAQAYIAGLTLHLRQTVQPEWINVGLYRYPIPLVVGTDTDWIAEEEPDLITDFAISWVLTIMGEKEIASNVIALSNMELRNMLQDRLSNYLTR